jgi:hypothetical protein
MTSVLASKLHMPAAFRAARPKVQSRQAFTVQAGALWQLAPDRKWYQKNSKDAPKLQELDLTEDIGTKEVCTVGTEGTNADKTLASLGEGVHVEFHAESADPKSSSPTDGPSVLYVKDVASSVKITVDGKPLGKGKVKLPVGSCLVFGDQAAFQVMRDEKVHA